MKALGKGLKALHPGWASSECTLTHRLHLPPQVPLLGTVLGACHRDIAQPFSPGNLCW